MPTLLAAIVGLLILAMIQLKEALQQASSEQKGRLSAFPAPFVTVAIYKVCEE